MKAKTPTAAKMRSTSGGGSAPKTNKAQKIRADFDKFLANRFDQNIPFAKKSKEEIIERLKRTQSNFDPEGLVLQESQVFNQTSLGFAQPTSNLEPTLHSNSARRNASSSSGSNQTGAAVVTRLSPNREGQDNNNSAESHPGSGIMRHHSGLIRVQV